MKKMGGDLLDNDVMGSKGILNDSRFVDHCLNFPEFFSLAELRI